MNDYIKREDAIETAFRACYDDYFMDAIKTVPSADVVEVSKILKTADEQEKQGFIQTAKVLRELVSND